MPFGTVNCHSHSPNTFDRRIFLWSFGHHSDGVKRDRNRNWKFLFCLAVMRHEENWLESFQKSFYFLPNIHALVLTITNHLGFNVAPFSFTLHRKRNTTTVLAAEKEPVRSFWIHACLLFVNKVHAFLTDSDRVRRREFAKQRFRLKNDGKEMNSLHALHFWLRSNAIERASCLRTKYVPFRTHQRRWW